MLGLALGDAVGSKASDVPATGVLEAGAATQLAAWTIEGTLRNLTRYGKLHPHLTDIGLYAYQRWGCFADWNRPTGKPGIPSSGRQTTLTMLALMAGSLTRQP